MTHFKKKLIFLVAFFGLLCVSFPGEAAKIQWYIEVTKDPITGNDIPTARVLTREGYKFAVYRKKDRSIWGRFVLPRSSQANLTREQLPIYAVDDNDAVRLDELKELESGSEATLYKLIPKGVEFIIWGVSRKDFIPPPLRQLMIGETLNVTYFTILGERADAVITLDRANQAIAQMLGVRPLRPDAVEDPSRSFDLVARRFLELCDDLRFSGDDDAYPECRALFALCSDTPDQTIDTFKQCLGFEPRMRLQPSEEEEGDGKNTKGTKKPRKGRKAETQPSNAPTKLRHS